MQNIILPVVLYGCETWSLTLREERRLRVYENRVLRRIFGPKRDEVTGEWRKLHNEELNNLYSSPNIVRVIKLRRMWWVWHIASIGERRSVYRVLVGILKEKRPLGRPRCRWEDNITIDLQKMKYRGMGIKLAQDRERWQTLVNAVMNLWGPQNAGNFLTSWELVSFSRRTLFHGVSKKVISDALNVHFDKYWLNISLICIPSHHTSKFSGEIKQTPNKYFMFKTKSSN